MKAKELRVILVVRKSSRRGRKMADYRTKVFWGLVEENRETGIIYRERDKFNGARNYGDSSINQV